MSAFGLLEGGMLRGGVGAERQTVRVRGGMFSALKGHFAGLLVI